MATLDVVGRRVRLGTQGLDAEIVGVAADARFRDLTTDLAGSRTEPDLYFPFAQRTDGGLEIGVRSRRGDLVGHRSRPQQPRSSLERNKLYVEIPDERRRAGWGLTGRG